jgi:tetratricopeptide (TPR) repeat protein
MLDRWMLDARGWGRLALAAFLAAAVGVQGAGAVEQDALAQLQAIYQDCAAAKTADQYTEVVTRAEAALAETQDETARAYGSRLMAWALNRRGELAAEQEDETTAQADFERAVELDPECWRAVHNRGVSMAHQGKHQEALQDFDRTLTLQPKFANAWHNRGELRYQSGEYPAAVEDYAQAIKLNPDVPAFWVARGHAYYRQGDYQAAVDDYTQALRRDRNQADAYVFRGDAQADLGHYTQAAGDYRAAMRIDPQLGRAFQSAAWLMSTCPDARFRNPQMAIKAAERALELEGDDARYLDTLAAAHASAGDFEQARVTQARAIQQTPDKQPQLRERLERRLALYERDEAYLDQRPNLLAERSAPPAATPPLSR